MEVSPNFKEQIDCPCGCGLNHLGNEGVHPEDYDVTAAEAGSWGTSSGT
jgi:hypothetical protein